MRKKQDASNQEKKEVADKPKAKRQTTAALRKEIESLKAANLKLLNEIGNLSAMYMNALNDSKKESTRNGGPSERDAVIMATKRIVAFLMQTYGFNSHDILK